MATLLNFNILGLLAGVWEFIAYGIFAITLLATNLFVGHSTSLQCAINDVIQPHAGTNPLWRYMPIQPYKY